MRRAPVGFVLVGVCLILAFCGAVLADFGYVGPHASSPDRWIDAAGAIGTANVVSGIYLNVRLLDTLLEVLVFAVAVLGVRFYLIARGRPEPAEEIPESRVVRIAADVLLPLILLASIHVTVYGHLSPGGGFAGGVVAGSGLLLAALAVGTDRVASRLGGHLLARVEWAALFGIFLLATVPILFGRTPLADLLPPGTPGRVASGGSTLLYNGLIGLKVFIGSWIIARHFVDHRGEI